MKKRLFTGLLVAVLIVGCLLPMTGCNVSKTGENGGETVTGDIHVVSFYNIWPDDENTAVGAAIKAYKAQTGSNVTYKQYAYDVYNNKMVTLVAGGNAPDAIFAYWGDMPRLAAIGLIQPVDNYVNVAEQNLQSLMKSYMWKGRYYAGSVQQVQTPLLWYNKTLLEREGITEMPYELWKAGKWDWNSFLEIGKKLTRDTNSDGEIDQWGFNSNNSSCFHWSNNASGVQVNDDGTVKITWTNEENLRADKFLQQIRFTDVIMPQDMSTSFSDFGNNKLGMTYGTYEFLGEMVKNKNMKVEDIGMAPFPTGPDFKGSYYAVTNLVTIGNGCKNPKGAGLLCDLIGQKERELFGDMPNLGNPEFSQYLTKEHMEVIDQVIDNAQIVYGNWGNWDPTYKQVRALLYDNQDPKTVKDSLQPLFQAAINDMLSTSITLDAKFVTPPKAEFESDLGYFIGDKVTSEKPAVTTNADEIVAGVGSMKLTSGEAMQVMAYTSPTKLSVPSFHKYHITFDYKILSAENGKRCDFAFTSRTESTLDNDTQQSGWISFSGAPGKTGTAEGDIEIMLEGANDILFAFVSGTSKGTVAIDNVVITDVTPKE